MSKLIVFDKGHGGIDSSGTYDPGACGYGLKEADLVDDICNRTVNKLVNYDVQVRITPRSDSLSERADFANNLNADYFCSMHINAGGGTGFESYIYTDASTESERIRTVLHDAIYNGFLASQGVVDRGKKSANFAVLRLTDMPAVLLEILFIDTAEDAAKLADSVFLDGLANEMAYSLAMVLGLTRKEATDATKVAIRALQQKGIINSPDYWIQNARVGGEVNGEYVGYLVQKATGMATTAVAIAVLHAKGLISSPNYWLKVAVPGKTADGEDVSYLIQKIARAI